jgi:phage N-6-adenine-methyltransferase
MDKQTQKTLFSSTNTSWETPWWLFAMIQDEFDLKIDLAADKSNAKLPKFFGTDVNALDQDWRDLWGFLNPPYNRQMGHWVGKAHESSLKGHGIIVCLVPARTDTQWWWKHARFAEVRLIKGRISFEGTESAAPFPSALLIFEQGRSAITRYTDYKGDYARNRGLIDRLAEEDKLYATEGRKLLINIL